MKFSGVLLIIVWEFYYFTFFAALAKFIMSLSALFIQTQFNFIKRRECFLFLNAVPFPF